MRWIVLIILLCNAWLSSALTVYTECSKSVVEQYGEVIITYTIDNDDVDDIEFPKVDNIRLSGTSNSSYTVFENGKFKSLKKYQFFITPMEVGTYVIPPATLYYKNKKLSTKSITIKVINGQGGSSTTSPVPDPQPNANEQKFDLGKNLFIRVEPDKDRAYVGEQVVLTYKVYSTIKYENMQMVKAPNYTKCITEEFNVDINAEPKIETYNNKRYYSNVFKKIALYPTEDGEIVIPPIMMEGTALIPQQVSVMSGMDIQMETPKSVKLYTNQVKLNVLKLPLPVPASFSGGVGKFTLQAAVENTTIGEGEPVKLIMKVRGTGNLKILQAPELNFEKSLQTYPPNVTEEIDNNGNVIQGNKIFEYLIMPDNTGNFRLPPVEFSYFDIEKNAYVTYKIPLPDIQVTKGFSNNTKQKGKTKNPKLLTLQDIKLEPRGEDWHPLIYLGFGIFGIFMTSGIYVLRRKSFNVNELKHNENLDIIASTSLIPEFNLDEQLIHEDTYTFLTTMRKNMITYFSDSVKEKLSGVYIEDSRGVEEEFLSKKYYYSPLATDIYMQIELMEKIMPEMDIWRKYKSQLMYVDKAIYSDGKAELDKNRFFQDTLQLFKELKASLS